MLRRAAVLKRICDRRRAQNANGHSQQNHDTAEDLKGQKPCKSSCLLLGVVF